MRLSSFIVKYVTFLLLFLGAAILPANTLVIKNGIGVKGVKPTSEMVKQKAINSTILRVDFQKIAPLKKDQRTIPIDSKQPLDNLAPKVVIDDVVVFLDNTNSLEGMVVYHGVASEMQSSNCLPTYAPG